MSQADIRSALVTAFVNGNFFSNANVEWENMAFTPPDAPWAAVHYMPAQPKPATLGGAGVGEDRIDGIFQVTLNYPMGQGEKSANDKYEAIAAIFKTGYGFYYGSPAQYVTIKSCGKTNGKIVGNFYQVIVTVQFYAFLKR